MATTKPKAATAETFKCPECGRTFARAQALGAHRNRAHGVAGSSRSAAAAKRSRATRSTTRAAAARATARRRPATTPRATRRTVDRDALLRALFPAGIPPRENLISDLNAWLDEAERLANSN
jgi:uncharacterized C2H2 Zn-finger protein